MLRHLDLGLAQNFLEMTNTERRLRKQMDDAQPRPVAKTFVDLNEIHPAESLAAACDGACRHLRTAAFAVALASLRREAIGMFLTELQLDVLAGDDRFRDR